MLLIQAFALASTAVVAVAGSAVINLTPSNFDDVVIKSEKPTLVEFFAPWCGHCKTLAPVYEELASSFEHAKSEVQIAKVDADAERDLGKRFGVQGFPTLKFFDGKSAQPEDCNARDLKSLSNFITEKTSVKPKTKRELPSEVVFLSDKTFPETIGTDKNVLVAFTAPWCGHCKSLAPIWEKVATDFVNEPNVVIAKVDAEAPNSKGISEEQGISSYPTIKWFAAGSKTGDAYPGGRSEESILEFVNEQADTHRVVGGGLDLVAGTISALDSLVAKFTGGAKLDEIAAEVKKTAGEYNEEAKYQYAKYYIRVFDKLNASDNYAAKELARLEGILSKGGLAPSKRDELQSKTNILRRFVDKVAEKVAEKVEDLKDEL